MKKIVAVVALVLIIGLGWFSVNKPVTSPVVDVEKVKVSVSLTPLSTPFFVAQQQGFYAKQGLNVEVVPCRGGVHCAELLQEGAVEYATTSGTVALFNSYYHDNIALLASFVKSSNDLKLLTLAPNQITSIHDLENKRIGIIKASASEYYFDFLLISNALQDLQVERVYLKPDDMVNALLSDQVDAISIWEPYGYRASQLTSLPIINLGTEGIFQLTFNLVTTSPVDALNARDKAMLLAIEEAITWIEEHPVDSIALISEQLNIKPEQVEWSWNDYIFSLTNDYILLSNLQMQARWASERDILRGEPVDVRAMVRSEAFSDFKREASLQ